MSYRTPSRPFDPTAVSAMNLVINEIQELSVLGKYVFIPSHGPFYTDSFVAFANGALLLEGVDYEFDVLHSRATKDTGKEVACVVNVKNRNIHDFSYTYQCVGGNYQNLFDVLEELTVGLDNVNSKSIHWVDITDVPETLPTVPHYHHATDFDGWQKWIDPLDQVRNALISNDLDEVNQIYLYALSKIAELQNIVDYRLGILQEIADNLVNSSGEPIGLIIPYRTDETVDSNTWVRLINTLVYGLSSPALIGDTFKVSQDPILDFPSNLLLKDILFEPLMTDNDEHIFLDNEHPAIVGTGQNSTGFWDLYDATKVFLYRKYAGEQTAMTATLSTNKTSIVKGEIAVVSLVTVGFLPGITISYQIDGIANESLAIPRTGTVTTNNVGIANLNLWTIAMPGQIGTLTGTMTVKFFILDGRTVTITYSIAP